MNWLPTRIVIAGVGLIGGSFALAIKAAAKTAGQGVHIVGMGRSRASLERAQALGLIDEIATDWAAALPAADLVLLAMPVGQMNAAMAAMAPHLEPQTLVTDAGSTKADVIDAIYQHLSTQITHCVPAHPIAGAEKSGPEAAQAALFVNRKVVLTPLPENAPDAIDKVRAVWQACGAEMHQMSPQEHDRIFAAVSHLPHLLAFGLVHDLAGRANADQFFKYAASGFRDFTRIAGSHPEMWRDICIANRDALLAELDTYLAELTHMRAVLVQGDGNALEKLFAEAQAARNAWAEKNLK